MEGYKLEVEDMKSMLETYAEDFKNGLGDRKEEDLTDEDFDFQGWLIPHISLQQFLEKLNFKVDESNNMIYLELDNPILKSYPTILQDDGMGYGTNSGKLSDVEVIDNEIQIWY